MSHQPPIPDEGTWDSLTAMLEALCLPKKRALPVPYYHDPVAGITLYCGRCEDVVSKLSPHAFSAVVSDPPYGMNWNGKVSRGPNGTGKKGPTISWGTKIVDDDKPFDPAPWIYTPRVILWGFHHYSSQLPEGSVLVWLKRYDKGFGSFLSDADLAWMKGGEGVYCFRDVSLQAESHNKRHPSQKPLPLMRWCLSFLLPDDIVLDPYAGSGTTLLAAKQLGMRAIGIEVEETHCRTIVSRLRQSVLPFPPTPPMPAPTQGGLFGDQP